MPAVQRSVVINAPIVEVFTAATDPNRGPEWNPNIKPGGAVPLPVTAGSQWKQVTIAMGRPISLTCTVVNFQPPYYGELAITGEQQGRTITRCEEVDSGTRLTQILEFAVPGGMLGRMMSGMAESMLGRELDHSMRRMKMTLEMEHGGADGSGTPR